MMWWLGLALRLLAAGVPGYLLWRAMGPTGLVLAAPLVGLALAKPIFEVVAQSMRMGKHAALRPWEGRYFAFRGFAMDIVDDEHGHRWLRTSDVRKVVTQLPGDEVLRRLFPDDQAPTTSSAHARIRADRLAQMLEKAHHQDSVRYRRWLLREVVQPAARRRARKP